jgi:integrase
MGLGPVHTVPLATSTVGDNGQTRQIRGARELAADARRLLLAGVDPIEDRRARNAGERIAAAKTKPFRECAEAYILAHRASWKNRKHESQWETTLETYCYPVFGTLPVSKVDTTLVLKVLEPIWQAKAETASRLRGRIESILDWATVRGYREGPNPARWRGHLDQTLPKRSKVRKVRHHSALPFDAAPVFIKALRKLDGIAPRALEFIILTATRTSEVLGATWREFDLQQRIWTIPGERMKAGREHRVPLQEAAVQLLEGLPRGSGSDPVFPSSRSGDQLSNMAALAVLKRMKRSDLTVHGFRSSFRDWASERTSFPREVIEMALAHAIPDKVEAAYRRGDLFDKRRKLMDAWAQFLEKPPSEVPASNKQHRAAEAILG